MAWISKYALAIIPPTVLFVLWKLGAFLYFHFDCQGNIKNLAPCSAGGFDLLPWLGFGLFWGPVLFWISLPISVLFLIDTGAKHIGSYRGVK